jgi:hypothetical protein
MLLDDDRPRNLDGAFGIDVFDVLRMVGRIGVLRGEEQINERPTVRVLGAGNPVLNPGRTIPVSSSTSPDGNPSSKGPFAA